MKTLFAALCALLVSTTALAQSAISPEKALSVAGGRFYYNLTADSAIKTGRGNLVGVFVASSTSCTIKVWDNTSAATTVLVNTFSASAATWYPLPFVFNTGLYVDVGGTCDLTVSYN
jgi:hypothetical protein